MPKCKILEHYPNADNWEPGDIVEITDPAKLIMEGKVEIYKAPVKKVASKKKAVK